MSVTTQTARRGREPRGGRGGLWGRRTDRAKGIGRASAKSRYKALETRAGAARRGEGADEIGVVRGGAWLRRGSVVGQEGGEHGRETGARAYRR